MRLIRYQAKSERIIDKHQRALYRCSANDFAYWDPTNSSVDIRFKGHQDRVSDILMLFTKNKVLSGSLDKTIRLWNLTNGTCESILLCHYPGIKHLAVTNDEEYAASYNSKGLVFVWNLKELNCVLSFKNRSIKIKTMVTFNNKYMIFGTGNLAGIYRGRFSL